jgi:hypothetical protein
MHIEEFLSTFCKFSIYGSGITIQIINSKDDTQTYVLTDCHVRRVSATTTKVDFIIKCDKDISECTWDTILNNLRSGDISVYNSKSDKFRSRTIINKWLLQFI